MPVKVKWDVDGKGEAAWGESSGRYEGPTPPKGSYVAKLKRVTMGKIKSEGPNKGKPRLSILLEIVSGLGSETAEDPEFKYYGAPVWDGVNIIKSQAGRANAFIHALTDGSPEAKKEIENKFWPPNMDVRAENVKIERGNRAGQTDTHIVSIGKTKINSPRGEILVRITTKMGKDLQGNNRAEIAGYLPYIPKNDPNKPKPVPDDADDDEEDLLDSDNFDMDDDADDEFTDDDDLDTAGSGENDPF